MKIFILVLCGFKKGERKPEVWTFLHPAKDYAQADKDAIMIAKARFPSKDDYDYINITVDQQSKSEMLKMIASENSYDWQTAIGYRDGKKVGME